MCKFKIWKKLFPKMLRSRRNLSSYIFFLDLFIEIHQLSVLSLFSKSKQWLFAGFLQELTFPMLGFWAAGSPAQEPPVRHRLSLNSPSCSKTDFATPNLLVTTCSLKTVSFSLPWREQQFVPLSVYVPEMLHPCILCSWVGSPERPPLFPRLGRSHAKIFGKQLWQHIIY